MRLALVCGLLLASAVQAEITSASYVDPTSRYGHNVVPGGEYDSITFRLFGDRTITTEPSRDSVFEDTEPRLVDVDGDGSPEVITVVSYVDRGAAIRIWDEVEAPDQPGGTTIEIMAEGKPIGTRFRWLAIVGAGDLDGDGQIEIAYVDRPHLAKTLRIVRIDGAQLVEATAAGGVTNHRIGEPDIAGGIRDCGDGPEMLMASADWSRMLAVTFADGELQGFDIGLDTSRPAFAAALACSLGSG